ncbi:MAG: 5-(carboxyamino)imidazole ribonucleotide mutase [Deltaproteobacteria bacterium]|nr:MAG: 5-(carboxyamino)imidazole ribonucleotide mutase [Deltaproteobacteria bacterium]
MGKAIILMGSKGDLPHAERIKETLRSFGIEATLRIASAHKTPEKVLEIVKGDVGDEVVFITVAGRSNALSGLVDAQTLRPVIACPPPSDRFGEADILSSLRMPSGVAPLVVLEPEAAALAAVKILALKEKALEEKIREYQEKKREEVERADEEVRGG